MDNIMQTVQAEMDRAVERQQRARASLQANLASLTTNLASVRNSIALGNAAVAAAAPRLQPRAAVSVRFRDSPSNHQAAAAGRTGPAAGASWAVRRTVPVDDDGTLPTDETPAGSGVAETTLCAFVLPGCAVEAVLGMAVFDAISVLDTLETESRLRRLGRHGPASNQAASGMPMDAGAPSEEDALVITIEQFVDPVDENLLCPICMSILTKPVSCAQGAWPYLCPHLHRDCVRRELRLPCRLTV
jgi:hypothetical protein